MGAGCKKVVAGKERLSSLRRGEKQSPSPALSWKKEINPHLCVFDALIIIIIAITESASVSQRFVTRFMFATCSVLTKTLEGSALLTPTGYFVFTVLSTSITLLDFPNNLITQRLLLSAFYRQVPYRP